MESTTARWTAVPVLQVHFTLQMAVAPALWFPGVTAVVEPTQVLFARVTRGPSANALLVERPTRKNSPLPPG